MRIRQTNSRQFIGHPEHSRRSPGRIQNNEKKQKVRRGSFCQSEPEESQCASIASIDFQKSRKKVVNNSPPKKVEKEYDQISISESEVNSLKGSFYQGKQQNIKNVESIKPSPKKINYQEISISCSDVESCRGSIIYSPKKEQANKKKGNKKQEKVDHENNLLKKSQNLSPQASICSYESIPDMMMNTKKPEYVKPQKEQQKFSSIIIKKKESTDEGYPRNIQNSQIRKEQLLKKQNQQSQLNDNQRMELEAVVREKNLRAQEMERQRKRKQEEEKRWVMAMQQNEKSQSTRKSPSKDKYMDAKHLTFTPAKPVTSSSEQCCCAIM